jgi:hypothetical protein
MELRRPGWLFGFCAMPPNNLNHQQLDVQNNYELLVLFFWTARRETWHVVHTVLVIG